jgi:hypothetical protein
MSESSCPVCAERCRRLLREWHEAKVAGAKKSAKRTVRQAKKAGCRWAKGKASRP